MKKFLVVMAVNMVLLAVILEILSERVLSSYNHFSGKLSWFWMNLYEQSLGQDLGSDTLVLGCSVAHQLYMTNPRKNYKITTGVDLMITSYLYAEKALKGNPGLKTIVIVTVPMSLCQSFENKFSYNMFVKPYYTFSNFRYFDGYLHELVARRPLALLTVFPFFKMLPVSDFNYQDDRMHSYLALSDFAARYLTKLRVFAAKHRIRIVLVPSPVNEKFMKYSRNCEPLRRSIRQHGLGRLFEGYFESIVTYPDSCFSDEVHFKPGYLAKHREEIISRIRL